MIEIESEETIGCLGLVWEEGMEQKGMKRIILEYSFLPYLGVLMEGMKNIFSCLGV